MSFKSSNSRRGQNSAKAPADKGSPQVERLQEMFPNWSEDDLKSVLSEVNGEVEQAVLRISEGRAEQWGSVVRKKEKRAPSSTGQTRESTTGRGESRGVRGRGGARGGRGIGGRGRGGHHETNGRHTSSFAVGTETTHAASSFNKDTSETFIATGDSNGDAWGNGSVAWAEVSAPTGDTPAPVWGDSHGQTSSDSWNTGSTSVPELKAQAPPNLTPPTPAKGVQKTPMTSKMSFAQVARPQEKPKPAPIPSPTPVAAPSLPVVAATVVPEPEPEVQPQDEVPGWEEPETVQAPTWDDEPSTQTSLPITSDGWITSAPEIPTTKASPKAEELSTPQLKSEPELTQVSSAFPVQLALHQKADSPIVPPAKAVTPVSHGRSVNSRIGNRFKTTDQAVIMPSTFGSSVEKLGMQFGSVSLGGEDVTEPTPEPTSSEVQHTDASARDTAESTVDAPTQVTKAQASAITESLSTVSVSAATPQPAVASQNIFQQGLPQQVQQSSQQTHTPLQAPPNLLPNTGATQSTVSSQTTTSTATSSPLTSFSTQQTTPSQTSVSPYQQTAQPAQAQPHAAQVQSPPQSLHQQFTHFPSHLDPATNPQSPPQAQQQSTIHQGLGSHGSYFRQPEQNYFHTPTPPTGQAQDTAYGSFGPLSQQLGLQAQGSHLGGFNADQFAYNDAPRGFYDSYPQQSAFGGRSALGHDDMNKSLSGTQQAVQAPGGLPQGATQAAQQQAAQPPQSTTQPQAAAGQPQQGYAPVPYYYNPYHQPGQFYGPPYNSGYGLSQYTNRYQPQQPPLFQPPNPTSASPANTKGPANVQPQSNPYAQGLYSQQHASSGYDDTYSHHSQLGHQHSGSVTALPSTEYGKQLYGQGIQSFMSMGQNAAPNAAPLTQRGASSGSSPETYKSYGPGVGGKDVTGAGVGGSVAGAQGALGQNARGGMQQQHSQGFYGANRFSSNPNTSAPPNQQAQQQPNQTHQAYPQGGAESNFYYQRGPSQQYWQ